MSRTHKGRNPIELLQVDRVPGNRRVILQRRLALLPGGVGRSVDLLELATGRILHDQRPGFIRFAQGQCVGMTRFAITPERFIGNFGYVRSAHDDRNTGGTDGIRHAVCFGDHAGHGADSDQSNSFVENELDQFGIAHRSRIAIDQYNFMARGRERLQ